MISWSILRCHQSTLNIHKYNQQLQKRTKDNDNTHQTTPRNSNNDQVQDNQNSNQQGAACGQGLYCRSLTNETSGWIPEETFVFCTPEEWSQWQTRDQEPQP
jgi:hypothetical protein